MKKAIALILTVVLAFSLTACAKDAPGDLWSSAKYTKDTKLGDGEKTVSVTVEAGDKAVKFSVSTDAEILGEALTENGLIDGEQGAYGLYVKQVNGITADYDVDGAYWSFYIGDDYAMSGVDMTEIDENAEYRLVYTKE